MFYVSSILNGKIGITDTEDNVTDYFSKKEVLEIAKSFDIDGVVSNDIVTVAPISGSVTLVKCGDYKLAIKLLSFWSDIGFSFAKRSGNFVSHEVLNISRSGANSYSYDNGRSKSYRSGFSYDEIIKIYESYENGARLEKCQIGRL